MTIYAHIEGDIVLKFVGTADPADFVGPPDPPPDEDGNFQVVAAMPAARPNRSAQLKWIDGGAQWIDPRTVEQARADAWTRIKAARDIAEVADFAHDGNVYQADRERINGAVTAAILAQMAGAPYSIDWTLSDNTTVTLDGAQMMAVGAALAQRVKEVFEIGVTKRAAIAAAASPAAADAITWASLDA